MGPNMGMPGGPNQNFTPQQFGGRMQGPGPRGRGGGGPRHPRGGGVMGGPKFRGKNIFH